MKKFTPKFKNILSTRRLGYSSTAAVRHAIMTAIVREEERTSQHGPVRVIMAGGKRVIPC